MLKLKAVCASKKTSNNKVAIIHSEHDEFIKREHAEYLARSIPNAEFNFPPDVSHFAPLQRPDQFNGTMFPFFSRVLYISK